MILYLPEEIWDKIHLINYQREKRMWKVRMKESIRYIHWLGISWYGICGCGKGFEDTMIHPEDMLRQIKNKKF